MLQNHSFETNNSTWVEGTLNTPQATSADSTDDKYSGNQSIKITKQAGLSSIWRNQNVTLTPGKTYTLSGYIKTNGVTTVNNGGACLSVSYTDGGQPQTVNSEMVTGTLTEFQKYSVTFTLPSTANVTVGLAAKMINESGTAYFDSLQLEEGEIANRYNLLENNGLETVATDGLTPKGWTINNSQYGTTSSATDTVRPGDKPASTKSYKMIGDSSRIVNLSQTVNVSGVANDTFVVGGWAKGNALPNYGDKIFKMALTFNNADATTTTTNINFNPSSSDWQYVYDKAIPDKA